MYGIIIVTCVAGGHFEKGLSAVVTRISTKANSRSGSRSFRLYVRLRWLVSIVYMHDTSKARNTALLNYSDMNIEEIGADRMLQHQVCNHAHSVYTIRSPPSQTLASARRLQIKHSWPYAQKAFDLVIVY